MCTNFVRRHCSWFSNISVEPTLWLYMMAYMITSVTEQSFYLYKSCTVDYGFSEEQCSNLNKYPEIKAKVQLKVSEFHQWNNVAGHIVPIILAMFIGNWSDHYGRKMPLIIGLIGKFIYSFMMVINSIKSHWDLNMIIYTASFPMGLLGGDITIFAACFAYISDITSIEERTFRVTLLDVIYLSAMPTGVAIGSFLFNNVVNSSYTTMFSINTVILLISIVYSSLNLKWQTAPNQTPISLMHGLMNFFDKGHVLATTKTLFKRRPYHGRIYLWAVLLCMILYTFQRDEKPLSFLYTQLTFDWGITEFSNFRTFYSTLFVLSMLITIPVMNKFLFLDDTIIIIIGAISHATGRIFFALANIWQIFYLGAIIAAFGPVAAPALRSIASKIVSIKERGKVFCILSVSDNAVPLLSSVMYSQLYNATIKSSPNQIFWLTFTSQIVVCIFITTIHFSSSLKKIINKPEESED